MTSGLDPHDYVGHISSRTRTRELEELFGKYGRSIDEQFRHRKSASWSMLHHAPRFDRTCFLIVAQRYFEVPRAFHGHQHKCSFPSSAHDQHPHYTGTGSSFQEHLSHILLSAISEYGV